MNYAALNKDIHATTTLKHCARFSKPGARGLKLSCLRRATQTSL